MKQLGFLKPSSKSYGGTLRNKRKGRGARPLATKHTMHLILKSTKTKGPWAFNAKTNKARVEGIIKKFSKGYGVATKSIANVGNHLHIHLQLASRLTYNPFIRAVTSGIAMAITRKSRWKRIKEKFWDFRPYTRVLQSYRELLNLRDYMTINQLEGLGTSRIEARFIVASRKNTS